MNIEIPLFIVILIFLFALKGLMFYISYKEHKDDRFKKRIKVLEKYKENKNE